MGILYLGALTFLMDLGRRDDALEIHRKRDNGL